MTDLDLVVRGRCVVGGTAVPAALRPATVGVRDGRIVVVETGRVPLQAATTVDLDDDEVLLPGLVDTHVHVNEPGRTEWEGFATATRAAACGGITTIVDMPLNSIPTTTDVPALAAKRAAATGQLWVDVGFWGGAVPANLGALADLQRAGVFGFKCFLVHSGVDDFAPLTRQQLDAAMAETAALDALLIVHAEDAGTIGDAPGFHGRSYADFLRSRPEAAETRAVDEVLELAAKHRARVHVLHLSSAAAIERLSAARAAGVAVSVETCPHYLTLAAEEVADGETQFKCCPPIRDRSNREALWRGLAAGVVDMVVSDHSPCPPALKQLDSGDFAAAWGGISSLQLGLPLLWTAARRRGHPLTDVVRWLGTRPARLVGVPGKGSIEVGTDADLVRFAPDETFVVDPARLQHRHSVTPYAGREVAGVVREVWLRGRRVVADAEPAGTVPTGRLLAPASAGR